MCRANKYRSALLRLTIFSLVMLAVVSRPMAQNLDKVKDLSGRWKFSIGDKPEWAQPEYDDSHWERVWVPKSWEEQGFHGYDGYAWYRTTFKLKEIDDKLSYYLQLGYIDDVDVVFINGKKIGHTGRFPPNYTTAFNAHRLYILPHKLLWQNEEITIAVRVFDEGGEGGIIHGDISILVDKSSIFTDLDLQGDWKFKTGDCSGLPDQEEYSSWDEIYVPGTWEDQGYKGYDGVACYATEFDLDDRFEGKRMVFMLGRIDDLDMVYLNGVLIGQSGDFDKKTVEKRRDIYKQIRGYYIPVGVLNNNGKNVLIVKVLDYTGLGGIWDGSIGLITQDNYIDYWRKKRNFIH